MNFDPVARYYDALSQVVFWGAIRKAQLIHLDKIKEHSKVLIVGGGTGWILDHLPDNGSSVTYVEPSPKMMVKSRNRDVRIPVIYTQTTLEKADLTSDFDVVISNFFFDQFNGIYGLELAQSLKEKLTPGGIWIITDFLNRGRWWQGSLLDIMYFFFAKTTGLLTRELLDWTNIMDFLRMETVATKHFYKEFIASICYQKTTLSI